MNAYSDTCGQHKRSQDDDKEKGGIEVEREPGKVKGN